MIRGLALLLVFQSLGEIASRLVNRAVPGPVLGLTLLFLFLVARQRIPGDLAAAADGMLAHLSIFFIPAAVGVMIYLGALKSSGPAWVLAIILSTLAAITTAALTLRWLWRSTPAAGNTVAEERTAG